jgi:hypothetical protein
LIIACLSKEDDIVKVSVPELPDIVISVPAANINVSVPESAVIV